MHHRGEEISLQELADQTEFSLSATSQAIDSFVRMRLVELKKRKGDRRVFFYIDRDLPGIINLFLQMFLHEEVQSGIEQLEKELEVTQFVLKSTEGVKREELITRQSKLENLIQDVRDVERYLLALLSVKVPDRNDRNQ